MASLRLVPIFLVILLLLPCCGTAPSPSEQPADPQPQPDIELPAPDPADAGDQVEPVRAPRDGEFLSFALDHLRGGFRPVLGRRGEPVAQFWDADGLRFCGVLTTASESAYRFDALDDMARLYDVDLRLVFSLVVLRWEPDAIAVAYSVPLGEFPVIDRFTSGPFGQGSAPFGLQLAFQSGDGGEEFYIFPGTGSARTLRVRQNAASFARRRDLDADGIDDLLVYEAVYEEGTGKETFITWYRWDGAGLSVHRTTNIVRNLNAFLKQVARLLEKGRFDRFVSDFLSEPLDGEALLKEPFYEAFHRIFLPDPAQEQHIALDEEAFSSLRRVAFPEILENPFDIGAGPSRLEIPVHFMGDRDYRYLARIALNDNPFASDQFYFVPPQP